PRRYRHRAGRRRRAGPVARGRHLGRGRRAAPVAEPGHRPDAVPLGVQRTRGDPDDLRDRRDSGTPVRGGPVHVARTGSRIGSEPMGMPARLAEIVDEFAGAPRDVVLEMLLEYADAVQPLPPELADHTGMEQVPECQTPFFLQARVQPDGSVDVRFDCPPEAPTTRAFAGILAEGVAG